MKKTEVPQEILKCLIVSYSYTGNTQIIAQALANLTGGDWHEIFPRQPYPITFPALLATVQKQLARQFYPRLLTASPSPCSYPVVFAGAPNWCGTVAPPLKSWLAKNDLAGKIILPFYSHCGGTPCDFQKDIARLCPESDVRSPVGIVAGGRAAPEQELLRWIEENGLIIKNR